MLVAQSCLTLCDPRDGSHQSPLSTGFPRQEYWSGLPFLSPEDLPGAGMKPSAAALAGGFFTTEPPGKPICIHTQGINCMLMHNTNWEINVILTVSW